jgi:fatty acid desaturase
MKMQASPEIRAVVKLIMFVLTVLVAAAIGIFGAMTLGVGNMMIVMGVALMLLMFKVFYDIQVADERYRDELARLQKTVRE